MGLKDDFLEALNSVKRDLFNGSNGTKPENIENDEENSDFGIAKPLDSAVSPIQSATGDDTYDAPYIEPFPEDEVPPAPADDHAVMNSFIQASSVIDDTDDADETGDIQPDHNFFAASSPVQAIGEDDDDDNISASIDETQDDASIAASKGKVPAASAYGSRVYDFDRTDLYSDDKTIISKNTVIRGALQTDDSVRLLGQVLGDIDCKSNIVIAGKVRGNTSAANAYVMDAQIDGSLQCDDVISISSDAWITGDVRAQQAEIDGKIKGNLDIRHALSIGSTTTIIGDISTDELEVKRGAFINGHIAMYTPSRDVLDKFDHFEE
ncbi:MAG: polymer-forming cytoskeletal protein [Oscillospiraceae bacterium]|nr:polymer-forming cytoskeletal protein [Oscillospiraceae bacterium]